MIGQFPGLTEVWRQRYLILLLALSVSSMIAVAPLGFGEFSFDSIGCSPRVRKFCYIARYPPYVAMFRNHDSMIPRTAAKNVAGVGLARFGRAGKVTF